MEEEHCEDSGARLEPVVLVPGERVVPVGHRDDVDAAVAVDVGRADEDGAIRERADDASREGLGAVVLVPRDRVVVVGRGERVDVAVAVDVGGEDGHGAVGERRDDALREGPVDPE